jgi:hypothetical protein
MEICLRCKKELRQGEEFGVVRVQMWKVKIGDKECKNTDEMKLATKVAPLYLWKD